MNKLPCLSRYVVPLICCLMGLASGASGASPKRVLILNPFGREVAPFSTVVSSFRATLARDFGRPIDFYDVPLELARLAGPEEEIPLVTFLAERIKEQPVDLVGAVAYTALLLTLFHFDHGEYL